LLDQKVLNPSSIFAFSFFGGTVGKGSLEELLGLGLQSLLQSLRKSLLKGLFYDFLDIYWHVHTFERGFLHWRRRELNPGLEALQRRLLRV